MKKYPFNISALLSVMLFFVIYQGCSNNDEIYVAKINNRTITTDEFKQRLSSFLLQSSNRDNLVVRKNILDNMVMEALLLTEAYHEGIENDPDYQRAVESIRKQALLDALRRNVVYDTVSVTEAEIKKAFAKFNQKVSARHLYARTKDEAEELLDQLRKGSSFQELAARTFQDSTLAANGGYLGYFGWGDMDPAFQKVAFSLKVGEISPPVKTQYGYSIIKVEDRIALPVTTEYDFKRKKEKIARILKASKSIAAAKQVASDLAQQISITFRPQALRFLWDKIEQQGGSRLAEMSVELKKSPAEQPYALNEELVVFNGKRWTIREFLEQAQYTSERQRSRVKSQDDLKRFICGLIVRTLLLQQAKAHHLHKHEKVIQNIKRGTEQYVLSYMRNEIVDTVRVPEEIARTHYEKNQKLYYFPEQVNIREILVDSPRKAKLILDKIRAGEDFSRLSRTYSLREWAAERGGELGYAPREKYGALADTIFAMNMGEVIGPLDIGGYYSIVKLIGRKAKRQKTFAEAKDQIEAELLWQWRNQAFMNYLKKLTQKYQPEINEKLMRDMVLK